MPNADRACAVLASDYERDFRVDLFRGVSLIMIFINHQEIFSSHETLRPMMLVSLCYCDALEIFVFLSGFASARAYGKRLAMYGYWRTQTKAIGRCCMLYLANVGIFLWVASVSLLFDPGQGVIGATFLARLLANAPDAFTDFLMMRYHPVGLNILYMYVFFSALTVPTIWLIQRNPVIPTILSSGFYLVVISTQWLDQVWPLLGMNIFAWQFLFTLGLLAGSPSARIREPGVRGERPASTHTTKALFTGLLLLFVMARTLIPRMLEMGLFPDISSTFWGRQLLENPKSELAPLRIINFLVLAIVAILYCPSSKDVSNSRFLWPLVVCGQHSLLVFSAGLIMNYTAAIAVTPSIPGEYKTIGVLVIEIVGTIAAILLASWASRRRSRS